MIDRDSIRMELKQFLGEESYEARAVIKYYGMLERKQYARAAVYVGRLNMNRFPDDVHEKFYSELSDRIASDSFDQFEEVAEALHKYTKTNLGRIPRGEEDISQYVALRLLEDGLDPSRIVRFYQRHIA